MQTGFDHELDFWRGFTRSERFQNNWLGGKCNPELEDEIIVLLTRERGKREVLTLLDIGSGPVSILQDAMPFVRLWACDPLADHYQELVDLPMGFSVPRKAYAEHLPYPDGMFDVVHIRNAYDHTQEPQTALKEIIRVCKPGGLCIIQGFENEAKHENYAGLHQWNVHVANGTLFVDGNTSFSFSPPELVLSRRRVLHNDRDWFFFAWRKAVEA